MLLWLAMVALLAPVPQDRIPEPKDVEVEPGTPQAWMLSCSAVLFERNHDRHDLLAGRPMSAAVVEGARKTLADWWDVKKREDLVDTLAWLEMNGHHKRFDDAVRKYGRLSETELKKKLWEIKDDGKRASAELAAKKGAKLGNQSILGWDLGRYVALCRWGYAARYLTEDEAWSRMLPVAQKIQKTFSSWEEFGDNFCLGREFWSPGENADTLEAFKKLLKDEKSPWRLTPWDVKLDAKPAMKVPAAK